MLNFVAVIVGFSSGIVLKVLAAPNYVFCGIFFTVIGLIGFLSSLFIVKTHPIRKIAEWNNNVIKEFANNFKLSFKDKSVFISMLGEAFFYAIGSSLQTVIILFARFSLEMNSDLDIGLLQIVIAVGIAIGCVVAGKLSKDKLELGLVAIGGIGMFFFVICTVAFSGQFFPIVFGKTVIAFYPNVLIFLTLAGFCGGLFVLPLKVCQQERTEEAERGRILAISNFCTFFTVFISGIVTYGLTGKSDLTADTGNRFLSTMNNLMLNLNPETVLYIIGFSLLIVTVFMVFIHREFFYRTIAVILTRSVYSLEVIDEEKLPEKGAAIIASNHVTLIDPFLIASCFSRKVTFVMHRNFDKHPFFSLVFRSCRFIPFPNKDNPAEYQKRCEAIKDVLSREELVCIFPENDITRDGMIGRFSNFDISDYLPKNKEVPLFPIHISNLWGSIFSYYFKETKATAIPETIFRKIPVAFGDRIPVNLKPYQLKQDFLEFTAGLHIHRKLTGENTLHYSFMKNAKARPFDKNIKEYNEKSLSAISMLVRSIVLSKAIRALGDDNKYVGVMLPNCNAVTITNLAVMYADKVPALLNFTLPKESLLAAEKQAGLKTIITSKQFVAKLKMEKQDSFVYLEDIAKTITKSSIYKTFLSVLFTPSAILANKVAPETSKDIFKTAILLFSSGSCGQPKGIMLSHHNINSDMLQLVKILAWKKSDKMVGNLPLFHSFGLIACFWMPLMMRLKVVYIKNPLEIHTIADAIEKYKLSVFMSTPTFLQGYMKKLTAKAAKSLRLVICGAEKLRPELAADFYKKYNVYPIEGYGCTELSPVVSVNIPESIADIGKKVGKVGSIGRPMPGIAVRILHPETFEIQPPGEEGLLFVKGPNVMQGYLDEEKTRNVFVNGWYNTGDIAKVDENSYITITGRLSRFSKIGGEMVSHQLLENSISEILNIEEREVVVTGARDKAKGEKLIVFYTDPDLSPVDIINKLKKAGVTNISIPKKENFIKIDKIPILGTGKLDLGRIGKYAEMYAS